MKGIFKYPEFLEKVNKKLLENELKLTSPKSSTSIRLYSIYRMVQRFYKGYLPYKDAAETLVSDERVMSTFRDSLVLAGCIFTKDSPFLISLAFKLYTDRASGGNTIGARYGIDSCRLVIVEHGYLRYHRSPESPIDPKDIKIPYYSTLLRYGIMMSVVIDDESLITSLLNSKVQYHVRKNFWDGDAWFSPILSHDGVLTIRGSAEVPIKGEIGFTKDSDRLTKVIRRTSLSLSDSLRIIRNFIPTYQVSKKWILIGYRQRGLLVLNMVRRYTYHPDNVLALLVSSDGNSNYAMSRETRKFHKITIRKDAGKTPIRIH